MATDRLAITVHGQLGTTELGTQRLRVSSFLNLQYDDDGLQLTGAHVSDRQGLRMTLIKLISSKFPEQHSDNKDHIDDLIKDDGDEESPATTPNVLVRQVGTDGTLYTITDEEDLVDAILLDADKAITFRLEIRGKPCEILSDKRRPPSLPPIKPLCTGTSPYWCHVPVHLLRPSSKYTRQLLIYVGVHGFVSLRPH